MGAFLHVVVVGMALSAFTSEASLVKTQSNVNSGEAVGALRNVPSGIWLPVFNVHIDESVDIYEAWYIAYWRTLKGIWPYVKQVRFSMDSRYNTNHFVVFDATLSTYKNWFSPSRILYSSYKDVKATTGYNYFSIDGFDNSRYLRRFYINRNHGGCNSDNGWMAVTDRGAKTLCSWENRSSKQLARFFYCPGTTYCNWQKHGVVAETLSIDVLF